jgi:DNA modification methylase
MADRIRFHLDENVDPDVARALRRHGIDVTTTVETGLRTQNDTAQLAFIRQEGRVMVTHDTDFLRIAPLGRNKRTVWNIPLGKFRDVHFAVFPEELVETCLLAATPENGVMLDPFMGSGTGAVVARKLGRHFLGIELVPEYVDMARQRVSSTQLRLF